MWTWVLVILWVLAAGQGCSTDAPCLTYDYVPCSASQHNLINFSNPLRHNPVHVILKTQETIGWQNVFFKSILTLLCVEYSPSEPSNQTAPYCWSAVTSSIVMNLTCNSAAIDLWVFEVLSQNVVSPPRVAGVLNEDKSKLALHFAGFTLLNVSIDEEPSSGGVALFEVPVLSWIFVGLGIAASLLVLSTPVWWDRLIVGLCLKWCRVVKHRQERTDKQLDSEET